MRRVGGLVERFADWFQSDAGVVEAFVVSTGVALVELIWPRLDPSHFWYLFVCTYWSAFTCNALANSSRRDAEAVRALLNTIKNEEDTILIRAGRWELPAVPISDGSAQ